jgi:mRNA deadenylase 3'-5' endonuclease subunit Ccr4
MLKILSLNVLCGTFLRPLPILRLYKQINKIKKINPDIICLQEFNNPIIEFIYTKELTEYNIFIERITVKEILRRTSIITVSGVLFNYLHVVGLYLIVILYPYIFNFIIGTQKQEIQFYGKKKLI